MNNEVCMVYLLIILLCLSTKYCLINTSSCYKTTKQTPSAAECPEMRIKAPREI